MHQAKRPGLDSAALAESSTDCFEFIEDPDPVSERPEDVPFVGCYLEDDVATQCPKCCGRMQ